MDLGLNFNQGSYGAVNRGSYSGNVSSSSINGSYGGSSSVGGGRGYGAMLTQSKMRQMTANTAAGFGADMEIIQKYLESGKVDKAMDMYEELFDEVKEANSMGSTALTDSQVHSIIKNSYEYTTQTSLLDTIDENTSGAFMTGFKQAIPIVGFFADDTSKAEAYAKITGDKASFKDKALEATGLVLGTVAFAGLGFLGGTKVLKGVGKVAAKAIGATGVPAFIAKSKILGKIAKLAGGAGKVAAGAIGAVAGGATGAIETVA